MADTISQPEIREVNRIIVRFAGDSGDGMQLTGERFTSASALFGNDLATLPEFPAEIRAPQGTLAERCRAGGAGIPAFYTKTGVGTVIADGKETKIIDGVEYLMEKAIRGDLAIIKAWKGDYSGNLIFRKAARNFNPPMAKAGNICVVEVEELVKTGDLDPDHIHLPGIYVDRIFKGTYTEKKIEFVTLTE